MEMKLNIPLDEDGFIEMECDFCKNRFMLHEDDFKNEDYIYFFCPICGLPNKGNTFYCQEVLEKAQQLMSNYVIDEIEKVFRGFNNCSNRNSMFSMSIKTPKKEPEKELYKPLDEYEIVESVCCMVNVKVRNIDKEIGIYCPICGGTNL